MNRQSLKLALTFCLMSIAIFIGCIFYSLKLHQECKTQLDYINSQYEETASTSDSWINTNIQSQSHTIIGNQYSDYHAIYKYNSTYFVSYSEYWDEAKLRDLALELYSNLHGDEINYVATVEVVNGESEEYSGYQTSDYENFSQPISLYSAMPKDLTMEVMSIFSIIRLTGGDINITVPTMARTLSHEYGHHFTQYYFGFNGTNADLSTKYATLRSENGSSIYSEAPSWEYYLANHMWSIQEIAAEDYVYLMGSPNAHNYIDYLDTKELVQIYSNNMEQYEHLSQAMTSRAFNSMPHENPLLRAPSQVSGLADLYYKCINQKPPLYTPIATTDLNIQIQPSGTYAYQVTWNQNNNSPYCLYTLVAYDQFDNIVKISKTTTGAEQGIAYIGTHVVTTSSAEYTVSDELPLIGFVRFRVVTMLPDATAYYSRAFDVQFS